MSDASAQSRLDTPRTSRRPRLSFNNEAVGKGAESVARFLGTGKYLAFQTIFVIIWILLNIGVFAFAWDPYPFILLNLAFSTQAAYSAPLILLAQNRQENRDKVSLQEDRERAAQTKADTEFLARELASVRLTVGETATRDYLRRELDEIKTMLLTLEEKIDGVPSPDASRRKKGKNGTPAKGAGVQPAKPAPGAEAPGAEVPGADTTSEVGAPDNAWTAGNATKQGEAHRSTPAKGNTAGPPVAEG